MLCIMATLGHEAIHQIFQLPIIDLNKTFQEFVNKVNKLTHVHRAEQNLKLINGNLIVSVQKGNFCSS